MATRDEKEILGIIDEEGGETHEVTISNAMGLRLVYIRSILTSMGHRDYIDVSLNGKVRIGKKGWRILGKSPSSAYSNPYGPDLKPDETPEERYKRYSTGENEEVPETTGKVSTKTQKSPEDKYSMTMEDLAGEASSPEEKFRRYMSK